VKDKDILPVSVIICALNEEARIQDAIESAKKNNPKEVIVVEGGSLDKTVDIAKKYADKVYSVDQFGLGYKRAFGVKKASQPYILNLDADQVLGENTLEIMMKEVEANNFVGIQAQLKGVFNDNYWEKAMGFNVSITHSKAKESNMIGTPALYKKDILLEHNFDESIGGSCDDTDLCYRLSKKGFKLGISSGLCYQKHRSSLKSVYKKFLWYGEGDCEFALKHPERFVSIFTHPIRNYIIKRSIRALFSIKGILYIPFFIFIGLARHIGFYKFFLKSIIGKKVDSRQSNRKDMDF
jgi:glycosyltransferase involved in cell wall biosynthesis